MEHDESRFVLERKARLQLQQLIADGNTPQKIVKRARIILMTAVGQKPRPKILFADQAVVTGHKCSPTLMVRIANGRMTLLTNATVRMGVVLFEENAEGHSLRRLHDLALSNASLSLFPMTWTVMHAIDEKSPLAGYDAERLEEGDARLFLSIEARDHAIGAFVHDMRIYTAVEVLFGMHYAEAVTVDDQRRPVA